MWQLNVQQVHAGLIGRHFLSGHTHIVPGSHGGFQVSFARSVMPSSFEQMI
jgi:hypothetical protein